MIAVPIRSRAFCAISIALVLAHVAVAQGSRPIAEIRGHATFQSGGVGSPSDHISINAWLDGAGVAHGSVAWRSASHGFMPPAPDIYPWHLAVTNLLIMGNQAFIEAVVVVSPQAPQDVGIPGFFTVVDHGSPASDEISVYCGPLGSINTGNFRVRSDVQHGAPACEVRGLGTWQQGVGSPGAGGIMNQQVGINAWIDSAGNAQGMMTWIAVAHQLPFNPIDHIYTVDPAGMSHPWYIDVTSLSIVGNTASVQGVVAHSPQIPQEQGLTVTFMVEDLGNVASSMPDRLTGVNILDGNFTVSGSCSTLYLWYCDMDGDGYKGEYVAPVPPSPECSSQHPGSEENFDCDDTNPYVLC